MAGKYQRLPARPAVFDYTEGIVAGFDLPYVETLLKSGPSVPKSAFIPRPIRNTSKDDGNEQPRPKRMRAASRFVSADGAPISDSLPKRRQVAVDSQEVEGSAAASPTTVVVASSSVPDSFHLERAKRAQMQAALGRTTFSRSQADWEKLKRSDADMHDQLNDYHKSGRTHLETQSFLARARAAENASARAAGRDFRRRVANKDPTLLFK